MPSATLSRRLGMGWGPQQPATDDIGNASVVTLGDGFDLNARTSYTTTTLTTGTGTFPSIAGVPLYVYIQSLVVGGPNTPTVTFTDGTNTNTLSIIPEASDQAAVDKKKWTFGFIPTFTTPSGWFVISYAGQTQQEQRWYVIKGVGLYTLGGIGDTYIADGFTGSDNSANSTNFSLAVQGVMDQNNVCLGLLWAGDAQLTTSSGVGSPSKLGDSVPHGSATTTFGIYYTIGDPSGGRIGMNWAGSFSNGGHYLELRSASSATPRFTGNVIGTPVHSTSPSASTNYPLGGGNILPKRGDLLVLCALHTNTAGSLRTPNAFTGTLTKDGVNPPVWTQAANSPRDFDTLASPTQRMHIYTAPIDGEPTAGIVTLNYPAGITGLHYVIFQIPGAGSTGLVSTGNGGGDAGTALSTAALSGNVNDGVIMFSGFAGTADFQHTEGSGFVERDEGRFGTPNSSLATTWRHTPDTTPDATISTALNWGAWAGEVQPGPAIAYPPLIDQSGTLFAPQVSQQVKPSSLIDQSGVTFSPQVNLSVAPGLIDQSGALFGPKINQQVAVVPLIDQSGIVFSPAVGEQIKPSLIDQSGTLFAPQVNLQVKPGLIDQSGVLFAPKVNQQVNLGLIDQSGALFSPVVSLPGGAVAQFVVMSSANVSETGRYTGLEVDEIGRVIFGEVDEIGHVVTPSNAGGIGLIDQSGVVFSPSFTTAIDVRPGLIDQHGVLFGPKAAQQIQMNLLSQQGVVFGPTLSQGTVGVHPDFIDLTGTLFSPQVNQRALIDLIDQSGVPFGPQVNESLFANLIDQSGIVFSPTVNQQIALLLIDQSGTVFAPVFTKPFVVVPLIDRSGQVFSTTVLLAGQPINKIHKEGAYLPIIHKEGAYIPKIAKQGVNP